MHWSCARVIRFSAERELEPALARNRFNHADRRVQAVEHGTLFDVEFHVSQRLRLKFRVGETSGIQAKITNGLSYCDAVSILALKNGGIQRAGERFAAEKRDSEPNAFLFRER